jgi:pyrroline-5-carboxylate reductase
MKPQQMADFLKQAGDLLKDKNVISMLTAIDLKTLGNRCQTGKVMRIMPNTPTQVGAGVSLVCATNDFERKDWIIKLLQSSGEVFSVSEQELDQLTVFTGSGPAYVYYFVRSYCRLLERQGYTPELSRHMMQQVFLGAAELMKQSDDSLDIMIDKVTSKGGVTIEAIQYWEQNQLEDLIHQSIKAASARNHELSQAAKNSLKQN